MKKLHLLQFVGKILFLSTTPLFAFAQGNYSAGPYVGTTGSNNSFVGYAAGNANSTGTNNSFFGSYVGIQNTSGTANSFFGSRAGYSNSTGNYNSFLGYYAGFKSTTGGFNSFVGTYAGYNNSTGQVNNFLGMYSGYNNTIGHDNNFLGYAAGYNNSSGNYNLSVGNFAGYYTTTAVYNSFLGGYAGFFNSTGSENSFLGYTSGYSNTTGSNNIFLGYQAGYSNTTGSGNTALGTYAGSNTGTLTNATAIGFRAWVTASNSLVLGSINGTNGATADTKVGIRTTAPAYNLHVNGTAAKPGGGSWTVASDQRLKQDVADFKDGLALIEKIRPVWFRYNGKAQMPTDKAYVGIIAQDMQKIAPYSVGEFTYQDSTGKQEKYLDYDASALSFVLVNAVKELKKDNETKAAQLSSQQEQITALQQELAAIKAMLKNPESRASGDEALLWQNEPNPTDGSTLIRYYVPAQARGAILKIYSMDGKELQSIPIKQKGGGQVQLSSQHLPAGVYVYHLVINGQTAATKKLVIE